jgi:hypothetical protein
MESFDLLTVLLNKKDVVDLTDMEPLKSALAPLIFQMGLATIILTYFMKNKLKPKVERRSLKKLRKSKRQRTKRLRTSRKLPQFLHHSWLPITTICLMTMLVASYLKGMQLRKQCRWRLNSRRKYLKKREQMLLIRLFKSLPSAQMD